MVPQRTEKWKTGKTENTTRRKRRTYSEEPDVDSVKTISRRMNLKEGEEAVWRILREVYRRGKVGTKDLANATRLPIPVAAAVRRELEKAEILARKGGAVLTEKGEKYVRETLGMVSKGGLICPTCSGRKIPLAGEFAETLEKLREYSDLRPEPSPQLDQAFATPETALRRALYMLEEGDLDGRDVLFLGDDDLTSIAAGLLNVAKGITVIDIDERLLDVIADISAREALGVECVLHDLRNPLPEGLRGRYDIAFTDPPYTVPGLRLFLSRGIEALRVKKMASVYLAFADKPPLEMLEVHRAITEMGLYVRELIPRFNIYEGAEMFANTTFMAKLVTTEEASPVITGVFTGKMYTGEVRPTVRLYRCRCGEKIEVGAGRGFNTIEELKARGCPHCGRREGFRLHKRLRIGGDKP
jgi:predicted methyltransferase